MASQAVSGHGLSETGLSLAREWGYVPGREHHYADY